MADSALGASDVIDYAIARTRAWGQSELAFWTGDADAPSLEEELFRRGAVHDDTLTVFARATDAEAPTFSANVTTEIVRTAEQVHEIDGINVEVWEQSPFDERGLVEELTDIVADLRAGTGGEGPCAVRGTGPAAPGPDPSRARDQPT